MDVTWTNDQKVKLVKQLMTGIRSFLISCKSSICLKWVSTWDLTYMVLYVTDVCLMYTSHSGSCLIQSGFSFSILTNVCSTHLNMSKCSGFAQH